MLFCIMFYIINIWNIKVKIIRQVAVQNYLQGDKTQQEVCNVFHCTPRSLMRWVDKYRKTGKIENIKRTPIAWKYSKGIFL